MSGRPVVRLALTFALIVFLVLPALVQAAPWPGRGTDRPTVLELLESLMPDAVRAWLRKPAQRGVTLKCSAGIDPNGRPCGVLPECSAGIDPDGKPCGVTPKCSAGIDPNGKPCS
ncbi:MAG TPA: hypothetical protein VKK31_08565 [Thermoanaerobaculia bacterium]|nr:hypothetical protein [Thermoanaerobaculia bacterium]